MFAVFLFVLFVSAWLAGAAFCAFVAHQKRRSAILWGLLAFAFSPFLVLLGLIAIPAGQVLEPATEPAHGYFPQPTATPRRGLSGLERWVIGAVFAMLAVGAAFVYAIFGGAH